MHRILFTLILLMAAAAGAGAQEQPDSAVLLVPETAQM